MFPVVRIFYDMTVITLGKWQLVIVYHKVFAILIGVYAETYIEMD